MARLGLFIFSALLSACMFFAAASVNAAGLDEIYKGSGLVKNEEINSSHKTLLGLEIGVNSLKDVKDILGAAVVHVSEDHHEPDTLCYASQRAHDDTVVVIESGPRCGPSREFVGFKIASRDALDPEYIGECLPSTVVDRNTSTRSGIRLGISPDRLIELIGVPTNIKGNVFTYRYDFKKRYAGEHTENVEKASNDVEQEQYIYLYAWVEAVFKNEKLVRFSVFEVDEY